MKISTKTAIIYLLLVLLTGWNARAQFVMQVSGAGTIEPRIFTDNYTPGYYITGTTNKSTYITQVNTTASLTTTHNIIFGIDTPVIKDMIVDYTDGTLAGIAEGALNTYIFRYDFSAPGFVWLTSYPVRALQLVNIHQTSANSYVVTGKQKFGPVFIGEVKSATGNVGAFQQIGFNGDFFSAYNGADIYGAGAFAVNPTVQNPATFRYNATTGINAWANNYVTPVGSSRIYPVAPIVDGGRVVVLSSGDASGAFNTYQTGPTNVWLHETDLAGNILWTKRITIPGGYNNLHAKQIINTATGYYLLIDNYLQGPGYENFFFVIKTDKAGNFVWANRYGISSLNKVIKGVDVGGNIYLTATSRSYPPVNLDNTLFLNLDPLGMAGTGCTFVTPWTANIINVGNVQQGLPFNQVATNVFPTNFSANVTVVTPRSLIRCSAGGGGGGGFLPCTTLTGSLNSGVVAYYPFGYGSLNDLSGNGLNLVNSTAAAPTFDRNNMPCAYRFNLTDYLELNAAQTFSYLNYMASPPASAFSISLWYQPIGPRGVADYEVLVGRGNPLAVTPGSIHCPDTWEQWSLGLYDCRKAVFGFDQVSHWETPTTTLTCPQLLTAISNNWHHVAVTYDGSSVYTVYVDNVPYINNHGPCGPTISTVMELVLGKDYTGDLDDVIMYNRQLTPAEVAALYAWPASSCCDGVYSSQKSTAGIKVTNDSHSIKLYPNPTDGQVAVLTDGAIVKEVSIYNATGILVNTCSFNKANPSFDVTKLPSGIYVVKVKTEKGESVEKLIKN